jgi:cold shock protein
MAGAAPFNLNIKYRKVLRMPTSTGHVARWFPEKRYGFIKQSNGDRDVFVHISAVEAAGLSALAEGTALEFEITTSPQTGKSYAERLKLL